MKILKTVNYLKIAKSKYPKSETEPYNPWAVCNKSTGGKKKNSDKFEKCVHHLKEENKKKSSDEWQNVVEAKKDKWIQDAVKKPGSFTEYCGGKVTDECIEKGKKSNNKKTRQRAELAETFRKMH